MHEGKYVMKLCSWSRTIHISIVIAAYSLLVLLDVGSKPSTKPAYNCLWYYLALKIDVLNKANTSINLRCTNLRWGQMWSLQSCMHQYRLEADILERSSVEKDLDDQVDHRLSMSQQHALMADIHSLMEWICKDHGQHSRNVILLHYSALWGCIWSTMSSSGLLCSRKAGNF